ncbi:hypothetical protein C8R44DRAFT_751149 [Mycena epipterygia]|nr:hypothetical protein C8R44DRAFT_751149 [Mycena epipterygia]
MVDRKAFRRMGPWRECARDKEDVAVQKHDVSRNEVKSKYNAPLILHGSKTIAMKPGRHGALNVGGHVEEEWARRRGGERSRRMHAIAGSGGRRWWKEKEGDLKLRHRTSLGVHGPRVDAQTAENLIDLPQFTSFPLSTSTYLNLASRRFHWDLCLLGHCIRASTARDDKLLDSHRQLPNLGTPEVQFDTQSVE